MKSVPLRFFRALSACVLFLSCVVVSAQVQPKPIPNPDRVRSTDELRAPVPLRGHRVSFQRAENDTGPLDAGTPLHLTITLRRSAEMQAAFDQLTADQQDPASPRFHQWLTPQQIGEQFGPTQNDLNAVVSWASKAGLVVDDVSPSRMFVQVSASAGVAANAFHVQLHTFRVMSGTQVRSMYAPVEDPLIPASLEPVVASVYGLSSPQEIPTQQPITNVTVPDATQPLLNANNGLHATSPGDFAIIYNLNPLYNAGYRGAGQRIAIIGWSRISGTDLYNYGSLTGLSLSSPNVIVPAGSVDPGISSDTGSYFEATLDVQRVLGTAPQAAVDLVLNSRSEGILPAIQWAINRVNDPILSISFGGCEVSATQVNTYGALFQQAASQGISVFVSSGDSGVAGCSDHTRPPTASQGAGINALCASSYVTCVGGTQFSDTANPSAYWASGSGFVSALGYIPEGAWNEPLNSSTGATQFAATGGGPSAYVAKPSYQAGRGVPADNQRDTPDISFLSSAHDGYFTCFSNCVLSNGGYSFSLAAGTSASAPSAAGIAALLNQAIKSSQGNLNPTLYRLATTTPTVFHDATVSSSGVSNCSVSTPSTCNNSTPGPAGLAGGQQGFLLTDGYDLATGLGSLNVSAFLNGITGTRQATTTVLSGTSGTVYGSQALIYTVQVSAASGTPTGTATLQVDGSDVSQPVRLDSSARATVSTPNSAATGAHLVTARYSGDGDYSASTSQAVSITVANAGTTVAKPVLMVTPLQPVAGNSVTLSVALPGSSGKTPTGTVAFLSNSAVVGVATLTNGTAQLNLGVLPPGSYMFNANYSGDQTFASVYSDAVYITIAKAVTTTSLTMTPTSITTADSGVLRGTVFVAGLPPSVAVSGNVVIQDGRSTFTTLPISKAAGPLSAAVGFIVTSPLSAGTHNFSATYSGETSSASSVSTAVPVTVSGFNVSASVSTLALSAGAISGNTFNVGVTSGGGFSGAVALSCTVAYTGSGTAFNAPTCSLNNQSLTLSPSVTTGNTLITVQTTAPRAAALSVPVAASAGISIAGLLMLVLPGTRKHRIRLLCFAVLAAGFSGLAGCGGGGSTSSPGGGSNPNGGTTAGSYTLTVTATGTSGATQLTSTSTVALTIR